ncbi:hypothetical protein ACIBEJ_00720 [Nonomuraea sp. NPDC050790]|uniref:hypothetical protein n=1 Tax=Nonomuraea sp. NPDC050790 TaxID=3364371 RepID=UPI0037997D24
MPVYLPAPVRDAAGPDGRGWNRLSLNAGPVYDGQCALKPTSYATLWESQDTRRARWGGFAPCTGETLGACGTCPVLRPPARRTLHSFEPDVLVRLLDAANGIWRPHVMNRPESGWESSSQRWTWWQLARLEGWRLGRQHTDEHSPGFWLHATVRTGGVYGERAAGSCS